MAGPIDAYDQGNGSLTLSWPPIPGLNPASYNVYVNGVLVGNFPTRTAVISGLQGASYNNAAVPPVGDGSHRPESLPPVGLITDALTYRIRVAAVVGGIEKAAYLETSVTPTPQSVPLTTPMSRGNHPFPSTPGGYT